jgi:hypothetical protein
MKILIQEFLQLKENDFAGHSSMKIEKNMPHDTLNYHTMHIIMQRKIP